MTEQELVKGLTYLGTAYGKEYSKIECEQHYDFLKDYSYSTFVAAIKSIIKKSKFLPKITEILEECDNHKEKSKYKVLEFMQCQGYFKKGDYGELTPEQQIRNYEKATKYLETDIMPGWFREDLNKYYKMMKQETSLEHKETLRIEG